MDKMDENMDKMDGMSRGSHATKLDLTGFDTSKITRTTRMDSMFKDSQTTKLYLSRLELVVFIYYNDGKTKEIIECHDDDYSEDVLSEMKNELKVIEYTVEKFASLCLLNEDVSEISGIIFRRSDDDSAEVLDEFSIDLEQPRK